MSELIEGAYVQAIKILEKNKDKLVELAEILIKKEVIFREDLEGVFGKRPWDEGKDHLNINGDDSNNKESSETPEAKTVEEDEPILTKDITTDK